MLNCSDVTVAVPQDLLVKRIFEDIADARRKARAGAAVNGGAPGGRDERDQYWLDLRVEFFKTLDLFPDARDAMLQRLRELHALEEGGEK